MPKKVKEPGLAPAPLIDPATEGTGLIGNNKLRQLYSTMLKCRLLTTRTSVLFHHEKLLESCKAAIGREATAVGTAADLGLGDAVSPSQNDLVVAFIKGTPLDCLFSHQYAQVTGHRRGHSASAHFGYAPLNVVTPALTIAARLNIATGVALANRFKRNSEIVLAYSVDGFTSTQSWDEPLRFAAGHDLSIVFVNYNDASADSSISRTKKKAPNLVDKAQDHKIPAITVDGNDVVAVYRVAQESIARARRGHGPTLIEATGRPSNSNPESKLVEPGEVKHSDSGDPINGMEQYLIAKGLFTQPWKQEIVAGFNKELDAAIEIAEKDAVSRGA
jgi:TPP-dependent pyruvate/acetoin dehydrogenase alpha subunit